MYWVRKILRCFLGKKEVCPVIQEPLRITYHTFLEGIRNVSATSQKAAQIFDVIWDELCYGKGTQARANEIFEMLLHPYWKRATIKNRYEKFTHLFSVFFRHQNFDSILWDILFHLFPQELVKRMIQEIEANPADPKMGMTRWLVDCLIHFRSDESESSKIFQEKMIAHVMHLLKNTSSSDESEAFVAYFFIKNQRDNPFLTQIAQVIQEKRIARLKRELGNPLLQ